VKIRFSLLVFLAVLCVGGCAALGDILAKPVGGGSETVDTPPPSAPADPGQPVTLDIGGGAVVQFWPPATGPVQPAEIALPGGGSIKVIPPAATSPPAPPKTVGDVAGGVLTGIATGIHPGLGLALSMILPALLGGAADASRRRKTIAQAAGA